MINHTLRTVPVLALLVLTSACGKDADDAKQDTLEAIKTTQQVAGEAARQTHDVAIDAADTIKAAADEAADAAADTTATVADKVRSATDGSWESMQANWADWSGDIQARWDKLSREDIIGTHGEREQLVQLIQQKYQIARDKAEAQIADWREEDTAN